MAADPEALFTANRQRLFKYFCRAVGQADLAQDLTQDVFVRVTRTAIPTADDGAVRAWLFRIARNLALDHHRQRARHPEPVALTGSTLSESSTASSESARSASAESARSASQDVDLAVNEALAALPDLDRDIFLMREVAGLGYDEIARACAVTPDGVRSRIHRARLQLRAQLAAPIATRRSIPMRHSGRDTRE
jgi:RNA polymerase sigma-70 factor (ECF subfamily)